jgi:hypothetical protein
MSLLVSKCAAFCFFSFLQDVLLHVTNALRDLFVDALLAFFLIKK